MLYIEGINCFTAEIPLNFFIFCIFDSILFQWSYQITVADKMQKNHEDHEG